MSEDSFPSQAANPLDVVSEIMPFGIPYGTPMSLEHAVLLDAANRKFSMSSVAYRANHSSSLPFRNFCVV